MSQIIPTEGWLHTTEGVTYNHTTITSVNTSHFIHISLQRIIYISEYFMQKRTKQAGAELSQAKLGARTGAMFNFI